MNLTLDDIRIDIQRSVQQALKEDIHDGDITAQLIDNDKVDSAEVITREDCVVCGTEWVNETFRQLGGIEKVQWHVTDGQEVKANTTLFSLTGNTRSILTGERTALNFLQLLSGIATKAKAYARLVEGTDIKILDTRKTIPGLRTAQKYAVACGGCHNHRIGLFDAFLIKENHIAACGGISFAIKKARAIAPGKLVEVETETLDELKQALAGGADVVMLDNFSADMLAEAGKLEKKAQYELSGNITSELIKEFKGASIDFISSGDLTKNCRATDLSMRIL
ncbi:carboxylating nicotinate-nucleotide diphosphorylase [Teredinibacter purpureus]|uniref:carboxylating nicotinate-nucleotide diphosphorylase n=1 Tax=Teredinibacter purpureus TaxID=2731756 RepID=UPI0005F826EF|nr:carboxylating nicotinate-nucleotide diphosphorylase [Teredinibacter purpureus]